MFLIEDYKTDLQQLEKQMSQIGHEILEAQRTLLKKQQESTACAAVAAYVRAIIRKEENTTPNLKVPEREVN